MVKLAAASPIELPVESRSSGPREYKGLTLLNHYDPRRQGAMNWLADTETCTERLGANTLKIGVCERFLQVKKMFTSNLRCDTVGLSIEQYL